MQTSSSSNPLVEAESKRVPHQPKVAISREKKIENIYSDEEDDGEEENGLDESEERDDLRNGTPMETADAKEQVTKILSSLPSTRRKVDFDRFLLLVELNIIFSLIPFHI